MTWKQTYTGRKFNLADPSAEDVCLEDIARSLAGQCRYTAHTSKSYETGYRYAIHYSVAQHSILMAQEAAPPDRIYMLLHDAHETYTGDVSQPLKMHMPKDFYFWWKDLEAQLDGVIYTHFGVPPPTPDIQKRVKLADNRMMLTEQQQFMVPAPEPWDIPENLKPYNIKIKPWCVDYSAWQFAASVRAALTERREKNELHGCI